MRSDGEARREREQYERDEQYKQEVKAWQEEMARWERNQSARDRAVDHEQIIRRQHVMIYGLPIALPPYTRQLSAPEVTAAIGKAFEEFQESTPDLKPSEISCVKAILENYPEADITNVKTWQLALDALREYLVVNVGEPPQPPTPPAVKDKAVEREREEVDDSTSTLVYQRGNEFRQLFVNIVADGTEFSEAQMLSLFNRFCKTFRPLDYDNLRAFLIEQYSPEFVDSPTAAEIAAWKDNELAKTETADEYRKRMNARGWR